jgi:hypothetical protein
MRLRMEVYVWREDVRDSNPTLGSLWNYYFIGYCLWGGKNYDPWGRETSSAKHSMPQPQPAASGIGVVGKKGVTSNDVSQYQWHDGEAGISFWWQQVSETSPAAASGRNQSQDGQFISNWMLEAIVKTASRCVLVTLLFIVGTSA